MMKRVATALAANLCLAMSVSESNYFMGEINLADAIYQANAFPIGVCSLTEAGITSLSYGVYTCDTSDQVTFEDYGADSTCTVEAVNTIIYARNDSLSEGDLFSFNCDGDDNYQVADTCTQTAVEDPAEDGGYDVCCQDVGGSVISLLTGGCLPYTSATGVCMGLPNANGTGPLIDDVSGLALYARTECDGMDSVLDFFVTPDCSGGAVNEVPSASLDMCTYFDTLSLDGLGFPAAADIYRVLTSCVADTVELSNTTFCTAAPTNMPTMEPTEIPTMEPTTEEEGDSAYALCFALSVIISTMAFLF